MQYPFSCTPAVRTAIENTLSPQRLGRYLVAAKDDPNLAMRLYVWNARLCEAYYLPCQFAEVAVRNRLHFLLQRRFACDWHRDPAFVSPLPVRWKNELDFAIKDCTRDHGRAMTVNHIVGSMSLGFWCHLLTSAFDHVLWLNGFRRAFPHISRQYERQDVYDRVNQLRQWRNRIAHHGAIFDKGPAAELQNIQEVVGWVCPDTAWFMRRISTVSQVINKRPRF